MQRFRLYKAEKLCSVTAIDALFRRGNGTQSAVAYPLRAVWRSADVRKSDAPIAFLISVPKKRFKHAVDRVLLRRRIREAYRLNKSRYPLAEGERIDLAFLYIADKLCDYHEIERAVIRLLEKMTGK